MYYIMFVIRRIRYTRVFAGDRHASNLTGGVNLTLPMKRIVRNSVTRVTGGFGFDLFDLFFLFFLLLLRRALLRREIVTNVDVYTLP